MIEGLFLLAAQPAMASEAGPAPETDIVVIGQRVRKLKFRIKLDKKGQVVCRITRSSGDTEIDRLACDTARPCVRPDIVTKEAMTACLVPRWAKLAEQVAARRRAANARSVQ
jgi:hypothetical protein